MRTEITSVGQRENQPQAGKTEISSAFANAPWTPWLRLQGVEMTEDRPAAVTAKHPEGTPRGDAAGDQGRREGEEEPDNFCQMPWGDFHASSKWQSHILSWVQRHIAHFHGSQMINSNFHPYRSALPLCSPTFPKLPLGGCVSWSGDSSDHFCSVI